MHRVNREARMPVTEDGEYVESDDGSLPPPTSSLQPAAPPPGPVQTKKMKPVPATTTTTNNRTNNSSTRTTTTPSSSRARKKKNAIVASSPHLERLYSSHRLTQEKMKKKREQSADPECTFSPKLNKPRRRKSSTGNKPPPKSGSRFDRLYKNHALTKAKIARKREEVHDEHCTFKPKTNKRRPKKQEKKLSQTKGSRHDLLYKTAKVYEQRKQEARQSLGLEECTFSPQINSRTPVERAPLYDYEDIIVAQSIREQQKVELELEGCTFSPEINERSRSPIGSLDLDVGERLYANAVEREQRRLKAETDAKIREEEACSFKPVVNTMDRQSSDDTFERLYQHAEEQRIAREIREQNVEHTFQPEINERSRELARHSDDRSLHEYLYKEGLAKTLQRQSLGDYKTTLRHRIEDEEMAHCTFDPKVWRGRKLEMQHAGKHGKELGSKGQLNQEVTPEKQFPSKIMVEPSTVDEDLMVEDDEDMMAEDEDMMAEDGYDVMADGESLVGGEDNLMEEDDTVINSLTATTVNSNDVVEMNNFENEIQELEESGQHFEEDETF